MTGARAVLSLPIASIAVGERIGFYHQPHAEQLGASMAAEGQHDPIHVRKNGNAAKLPWTLVAGLHRLRGAGFAGLETVDAIQVADASADAAGLRRLELSENLDHRDRRPIERSILMVERARLEEEAAHPGRVGEASQARAARMRWDASALETDASWRDRTAAALGCSVRQLEKYQRLHRTIVEGLPDLAQALNFHPLGASLTAMTRLAQVKDGGRRAIAAAILADPEIPSVEEALARVTNGPRKGDRSPSTNDDDAFVLRWNRMSLNARAPIALHMAATIEEATALEIIACFRERGLLA